MFMIFTKWLVPFHKFYNIKQGLNVYPSKMFTFISSVYVAMEMIKYA